MFEYHRISIYYQIQRKTESGVLFTVHPLPIMPLAVLVFLQPVWCKFERSKLWAPHWGDALWRDGFRAIVWSCLHLGIFNLHDLCHALRTHMLDPWWFWVCICDRVGARFALFSVKLQHFGVRSSHQWLQMWTALFSCCSVKAEAIFLSAV